MISPPTSEEVLDDLGDKVIEAFSRSITRTRKDLARYREWRPSWVARHGERGLANWIHDFLWFHLTDQLDGIPGVLCVDREPTREILVGTRYRLRAKRHARDGQINSYPTQTVIEFKLQGVQPAFSGMEEIRLVVGYVWDQTSREIGTPVLSLHDGREEPVWLEYLPEVDAGEGYEDEDGTVAPLLPTVGPSAPVVELAHQGADHAAASAVSTGNPPAPVVELAGRETGGGTVAPMLPAAEPSAPEIQLTNEANQNNNEAEGAPS